MMWDDRLTGGGMASPAAVLANSGARSPQAPSCSKVAPKPQIHVPRQWRSAYALNTIAGDCCTLTVEELMLGWLRENNPLSTIVARFTLECMCKKHSPFCLNGVTASYRKPEGIVACVRFVAQHDTRFRHVHAELYYWTTGMLRQGEASLVATVIEQVPEARHDIGRALKASWNTLAHLRLYCAAVKYECIALGDKRVGWLLGTRITQPWPEKQRAAKETFEEAAALKELGTMALYFRGKTECNTLPKHVQWKIIRVVLWLTAKEDQRPALPWEIVLLVLSKMGLAFGICR